MRGPLRDGHAGDARGGPGRRVLLRPGPLQAQPPWRRGAVTRRAACRSAAGASWEARRRSTTTSFFDYDRRTLEARLRLRAVAPAHGFAGRRLRPHPHAARAAAWREGEARSLGLELRGELGPLHHAPRSASALRDQENAAAARGRPRRYRGRRRSRAPGPRAGPRGHGRARGHARATFPSASRERVLRVDRRRARRARPRGPPCRCRAAAGRGVPLERLPDARCRYGSMPRRDRIVGRCRGPRPAALRGAPGCGRTTGGSDATPTSTCSTSPRRRSRPDRHRFPGIARAMMRAVLAALLALATPPPPAPRRRLRRARPRGITAGPAARTPPSASPVPAPRVPRRCGRRAGRGRARQRGPLAHARPCRPAARSRCRSWATCAVAGLTVPEIKAKLTELLGRDYLVRPQVEVTVKEYQSQFVTVLGEVVTPGASRCAGARGWSTCWSTRAGSVRARRARSPSAAWRARSTTAGAHAALRGGLHRPGAPQAGLETTLRHGDVVSASPKYYVTVEGEVNRPGPLRAGERPHGVRRREPGRRPHALRQPAALKLRRMDAATGQTTHHRGGPEGRAQGQGARSATAGQRRGVRVAQGGSSMASACARLQRPVPAGWTSASTSTPLARPLPLGSQAWSGCCSASSWPSCRRPNTRRRPPPDRAAAADLPDRHRRPGGRRELLAERRLLQHAVPRAAEPGPSARRSSTA